MAAPSPSYIRLPDDTGNAGKKVRTQTRVIGADTVHEHFFIPISRRSKTGVYVASYGNITVAATAQAATGGHAWLINPVGSSIKVALRRVEVNSMIGATTPLAAVATTVDVERVTFTGTASGAEVANLKAESSMASSSGHLYSASTGLTLSSVSSNAAMYTFLITALITAVGCAVPVLQEWEPDEDGMPVLAAGEGLVFRQPTVGVTSDVRKFNLNIAWEEYE